MPPAGRICERVREQYWKAGLRDMSAGRPHLRMIRETSLEDVSAVHAARGPRRKGERNGGEKKA